MQAATEIRNGDAISRNLSAGAIFALVAVYVTFGFSPLGRAEAPAPAELRVQLPTEPVSLDPALADDDFAAKVLGNIMDGLMGYDGAGKLENRLAQSYALSRDRKTYTFTLRKGALWSDGKAVRAEDFALGLKRALDPKLGAKLANMLFPIRGARAFNAGKASADGLGVAVVADKLVITLEKPASYFVHVLAMSQADPMRADVLAAHGGKWPEIGPVTGAYAIDAHTLEKEIHLAPNPKYWNFKTGTLPVSFKIIPEEATAASLFEAGKLDVVQRIAPADYVRFKALGVTRDFPQAATYFLAFSAKKPPFDDREMRRAVAGAIHREDILSSLLFPNRAADGWIPADLLPRRKHKMDPRQFAASLQAMRAKLKAQPVSVTASFNTNAVNTLIMEKLQFDLHKALGMDVQLNNLDWKSYVGLIRSDTPQIYRYQRGAPFMDPVWHLVSFKGDDANNPTGWKNPEYDRLVDQIVEMPLGPARQAVIEKAEKILVQDDAVLVPLFFPVQAFLVSERTQGFRANPIGVTLFAEISVKSSR